MGKAPVYRASQRRGLSCFMEHFTVTSYPLHSHECYEIELVYGHGCHNVIDSVDYIVDGAMCFVYMPYTRHYYYSDGDGGASVYRIGFTDTFISGEYMDVIYSLGKSVSVALDEGAKDFFDRLCREMLETYFNEMREPFDRLLLKAEISRLIVSIYELYSRQTHFDTASDKDALSGVFSYINKNFNKQLSLNILSDVAGMSPAYFSKYFKSRAGMTYTAYVTGIRMNYAVNLLKMTTFSLKKISFDTGYYSESGFIKAFKRFFGSHPETFRNENSTPKTERDIMRSNPTNGGSACTIPVLSNSIYGDERFKLKPSIYASSELLSAADVFRGYVKRLFDIDAAESEENRASVLFMYDAELDKEAYRMESGGGRALIYASSVAGASHGASVLLQLFDGDEKNHEQLTLPKFSVCDCPDIEWRGIMIDLARGNYPLRDILAYADLCYFLRLSVLHLHFADGPGANMYKLPSKRFPKLSGMYSENDIKIINDYLSERGITLLPEIEMPAHAEPLIEKYPEIFGPYHGNMICPGHDGVFEGLNDLIGEVCELFPDSPYIHIGCDEAQYLKWDNCPQCRRFMEENGIASSAELYTYVVGKAARMTLSYGRTPIVWEGFPAEGSENIPSETIIMVFQSTYQTADALTKAGFRVINTSWQPLYVVPSRPKYWPPADIYSWKFNRWLYEDAVDDSNPLDVDENKAAVMGAELCVWESRDFDYYADVIASNLCAVAERTWNEIPCLPYEQYKENVDKFMLRVYQMIEKRDQII